MGLIFISHSSRDELAAAADYVFRKHGAQGIGYFALVAAGRNAYYPHYHGGRAELKRAVLRVRASQIPPLARRRTED